jgi:hypothetical protein
MNFVLTDPTKNQYNLFYNFYNTNVYFNQVEKNVSLNGYIKVPFVNSLNTPNIIYDTNYYTQNLYIFKAFHIIKDIQFNGELIIELNSPTNSSNKIYVCLLLNTITDTSGTEIDTIIQNTQSTSMNSLILNLNKYITSNTSVLYNDINGNKIVIFTTPINISSSLTNFNVLPDFIFSLFNNNYSIIKTSIINNPISTPSASLTPTIKKEGFKNIESLDPIDHSDIYIDCKPTGVSAEEIATYQLPINSSLINDVNSNKISQTITAFFIFLFFLIISSLISPLFYHNFVWYAIKNDINITDKYTTLKSIDILLIVFFLILSLLFIGIGFSKHNIQLGYVGIIFLIILFSSYSVISFYKLTDNKPPENRYTFVETKNDNTMYNLFLLIGNFSKLFFDGFIDITQGNLSTKTFFSFYIIICIILLFLIFYYTNQIPLIIVIILWVLIGLISLYVIIHNKTNSLSNSTDTSIISLTNS